MASIAQTNSNSGKRSFFHRKSKSRQSSFMRRAGARGGPHQKTATITGKEFGNGINAIINESIVQARDKNGGKNKKTAASESKNIKNKQMVGLVEESLHSKSSRTGAMGSGFPGRANSQSALMPYESEAEITSKDNLVTPEMSPMGSPNPDTDADNDEKADEILMPSQADMMELANVGRTELVNGVSSFHDESETPEQNNNFNYQQSKVNNNNSNDNSNDNNGNSAIMTNNNNNNTNNNLGGKKPGRESALLSDLWTRSKSTEQDNPFEE